jgi:myo-inositol 2-dehydrogenase/D-chiro-inositol 1-dehydrogenase
MVGNETEDVVVKATQDGFHTARLPDFFMQRYAPCYIEEIRQFIECVREDKPTPVDEMDGRLAVVLGCAAWKSIHEKRSVKLAEYENSAGVVQ